MPGIRCQVGWLATCYRERGLDRKLMANIGKTSFVGIALALVVTAALCTSVARAAEIDAGIVAGVAAYGQANFDNTTGLVRDAAGQPNLAESTPGYLAALLIQSGHGEQAQALVRAILANQDTQDGSQTIGYFRWYGGQGQPFSYDATLYAVPPLAWVLQNYRQELGSEAEALAGALNQAVAAIQRNLVEPHNEAYLMLQAAARASAGAALDKPAWVSSALSQVRAWLNLVKSHGLPEGHSPTFDCLRLASLLWVQNSLSEPSAELTEAIRLARADVGMRLWAPRYKMAGAMYRSFPSDYLRSAGVSAYVLARYFGIGAIAHPEPFAMYFLLPAAGEPVAPPRLEMPYHINTRADGPTSVTATTTFVAPEFSLGTMCGTLQASSVPVLICFAEHGTTSPTAYTQSYPAPAHVSAIQSEGMALCSFDFDNVGFGRSRQAYVSLVLGNASDMESIAVRGGEWNREPTGLAQLETMALATRGCYIGIVVGRCGPAEGAIERRVKPGDLHWVGQGDFSRLALTIYGRQAEYTLRRPLHDVRVVFGLCVVPQSQYPSLADFAAEFGKARIRQEVKPSKQRVDDKDDEPKPMPTGGIIPEPKPKRDIQYRHLLEHTVELQAMGSVLQLTEDMRAGELLSTAINDTETSSEYLWSAPSFEYAAGADLAAALAAAGY